MTKPATRKRNIVGEGRDFRLGEAVNGPRAAVGASDGGAMKTAAGRKKDETRDRLQRAFAEREAIMRDPERKKAQGQTNQEALKSIFREMIDPEGPDYGAVMDFAQDYVPLDTRLGAASRKAINRGVARKYLNKKK